jgi:hypothetical protein
MLRRRPSVAYRRATLDTRHLGAQLGLARDVAAIPDPRVREAVCGLARALAAPEGKAAP